MPAADKQLEKEANSPATTSPAYRRMELPWAKMGAVLGGTDGMRSSGALVLPQHEGESAGRYAERAGRAVLFNVTKLTRDQLVGFPFSHPVIVDEEAEEDLERIFDDVDLEGNNIDVVARDWFCEGMSKAFSAVMVEFPRRGPGPRTAADDKNLRPYWVRIPPENIIDGWSTMIDGRELWTHVRLSEMHDMPHGFTRITEHRIRVFDLIEPGPVVTSQFSHLSLEEDDAAEIVDDADVGGKLEPGQALVNLTERRVRVQVWRETEESRKKSEKDEWEVIEEFFMEIDEIPLVVFYADRSGTLEGTPPLIDLANLNILHYQSVSDAIMVLTIARFPMLAASGTIDEDEVLVGPDQIRYVVEPEGRWYYVEHNGAAIQSGQEFEDRLVEQMAQHGGLFLKRRPGQETATGRVLDSAEATSPLQDMVVRFVDALNTAVWLTRKWNGVADADVSDGVLDVHREWGIEGLSGDPMGVINKAKEQRWISREAWVEAAKRFGILPEDYDPKEDQALIDGEEDAALARVAGRVEHDPGDPGDPPEDPKNPPAGGAGSGGGGGGE